MSDIKCASLEDNKYNCYVTAWELRRQYLWYNLFVPRGRVYDVGKSRKIRPLFIWSLHVVIHLHMYSVSQSCG